MVIHMVGRILEIEAMLFLAPLVCSLIYGETKIALWFILCAAAAFVLGFAASRVKTVRREIFAKEGFLIVTVAWVVMSLVGALPFTLSGEIPSYIDAFFETVSGFTTTGASILDDVEAMSHGLLFWRSFTHWVGGMGVLVFVMAILPTESGGRSIHIMRAEVPGPIVGKLVPKIRDTAKILYLIYVAMTALEVVLLICGGMPLFDSLLHAFGTAGTGGFGIKADSITSYSPYLQWVITVFMLLFGVNFNLYYLLLIGKFRSVFKSSELWTYFAIVAVSTAAICINILSVCRGFAEALRLSSFQVATIVTTTGYATADFNAWPEFSRHLMIALMFVGGCAGSTAGGLKISRLMLAFKMIRRELKKLLRPRSVSVVKLEGKTVDAQTLSTTAIYLITYAVLLFFLFLLVALDGKDVESTFTAVLSCFNNVGPFLSKTGYIASYSHFSGFSKVLLSLAMLLGRLEIFPILVTLSPSMWKRQ